jgi:hypothetical protein
MPSVKVVVRGVKINTLLDPKVLLTPGLVPPDGQPAGSPIVEVALEGSSLVVAAMLNGKSVRRAIKAIIEQGEDNVHCLLQGNLKPGELPGTYFLDCAGLAVTPKAVREPKPEAAA